MSTSLESEDQWQRRLESAVSGVANALSSNDPSSIRPIPASGSYGGAAAAAGAAAGGGWRSPSARSMEGAAARWVGRPERQSAQPAAERQSLGSGAPVAAAALGAAPKHEPGDADALEEWHSRQRRQLAENAKQLHPQQQPQQQSAPQPQPQLSPASQAPAVAASRDGPAWWLGPDGPSPEARRVAEAVRARAAQAARVGEMQAIAEQPELPTDAGRDSSLTLLDELSAEVSGLDLSDGDVASFEPRVPVKSRAVGEELQMEREYREGIEAALQAEVTYRDKLKGSLESALAEEKAARERAEGLLATARSEVRDERSRRVEAEQELRRVQAELSSTKEHVAALHEARDGACADLATEKQQRRIATSDLARAAEYSRELEALYRAGLQNSRRGPVSDAPLA